MFGKREKNGKCSKILKTDECGIKNKKKIKKKKNKKKIGVLRTGGEKMV